MCPVSYPHDNRDARCAKRLCLAVASTAELGAKTEHTRKCGPSSNLERPSTRSRARLVRISSSTSCACCCQSSSASEAELLTPGAGVESQRARAQARPVLTASQGIGRPALLASQGIGRPARLMMSRAGRQRLRGLTFERVHQRAGGVVVHGDHQHDRVPRRVREDDRVHLPAAGAARVTSGGLGSCDTRDGGTGGRNSTRRRTVP